MGVRITGNEGKTAIYDSATGTAFGPVFDSNHDADQFLDWLDLQGYEDARLLSPVTLDEEYVAWAESREGNEE